MIAVMDHPDPPRRPAEPEPDPNLNPTSLPSDLDVALDPSLAAADFGGLVHYPAAALIRPTTATAVSSAVRHAAAHPTLTVAARGNGHSVHGQSMAAAGLVLDMRSLAGKMELVRLPAGEAVADVGGGALWSEVLEWTVANHGMAPGSWTDYLGLTVGGTLSVGGVGGQAFRRGPQVSNVEELEVVDGQGDVHVCSPSSSETSDLFFAVLGGLGQFGVITRARIRLFNAPKMVRWVRVVYTEFAEFAADSESLVLRPESKSLDYLEGFAFVNAVDDPVNGWGSVPIRPGSEVNIGLLPAESGRVLYCLELALYYDDREVDGVDKWTKEMMTCLRHVHGLEFVADVGYVEFLTRVQKVEDESRAAGTWQWPHPWLNLLVASSDIAGFDRHVIKGILHDGIGGPMLIYPLLRSKWDQRTSVVVPDSEVFYLVALLRVVRPEEAEEAVEENERIVECCKRNGYDFKVYIPSYKSEGQWGTHYGEDGWRLFVDRKRRYDQLAVLAPGQRIFSRVMATAGDDGGGST